MAFEKITPAPIHLPHFCNTKPDSCDCGYLFAGRELDTTIGELYFDRKNERTDGYPEKEEAIASAEFISFAFELQGRYDLSYVEQAVALLERTNEGMTYTEIVEYERELKELLTKIKK